MNRAAVTSVVERNRTWSGHFETEPWEAAWASEAIFFVRALTAGSADRTLQARVQISPDGLHWCDEGTTLTLPSTSDGVTYCRIAHFGGWLRLAGDLPSDASLKVIVYLSLKE
jgi:hypothetical protein